MTSIIAMPHFKSTFNVESVGTGAAVIFSLYVVYVSLACGGPVIADRLTWSLIVAVPWLAPPLPPFSRTR
jgi:hypothetical protein